MKADKLIMKDAIDVKAVPVSTEARQLFISTSDAKEYMDAKHTTFWSWIKKFYDVNEWGAWYSKDGKERYFPIRWIEGFAAGTLHPNGHKKDLANPKPALEFVSEEKLIRDDARVLNPTKPDQQDQQRSNQKEGADESPSSVTPNDITMEALEALTLSLQESKPVSVEEFKNMLTPIINESVCNELAVIKAQLTNLQPKPSSKKGLALTVGGMITSACLLGYAFMSHSETVSTTLQGEFQKERRLTNTLHTADLKKRDEEIDILKDEFSKSELSRTELEKQVTDMNQRIKTSSSANWWNGFPFSKPEE